MSVYKTTNHILSNPYEKLPENLDSQFSYYKVEKNVKIKTQLKIEEIKVWEQIYYEPGIVGIYAAHDPNIEFYMITYNFFIDRNFGIETFYGEEGVNAIIHKTKQLGIDLNFTTE